jgi:hypothetical protein
MNGNNIIHKTTRGDEAEEKAVIGKDKPRRKRTPIIGGPRKRIAGDNDDGGWRLEKEAKPTNRTGNRSATIWP